MARVPRTRAEIRQEIASSRQLAAASVAAMSAQTAALEDPTFVAWKITMAEHIQELELRIIALEELVI